MIDFHWLESSGSVSVDTVSNSTQYSLIVWNETYLAGAERNLVNYFAVDICRWLTAVFHLTWQFSYSLQQLFTLLDDFSIRHFGDFRGNKGLSTLCRATQIIVQKSRWLAGSRRTNRYSRVSISQVSYTDFSFSMGDVSCCSVFFSSNAITFWNGDFSFSCSIYLFPVVDVSFSQSDC